MTASTSRARVVQIVALAIAIVLIGVALMLGVRTLSLRNDPALDNRALIAESVGRDVTAVVSRGLVQVLSYDWQQPDATRAAADQLLSGQARKEYDTLFASLQERAPGQKLVLTSQVQVAGIQRLTTDSATLLVFVDQSSTRAKDKEASVSAAQLRVEVKRRGPSWVITGLQPL